MDDGLNKVLEHAMGSKLAFFFKRFDDQVTYLINLAWEYESLFQSPDTRQLLNAVAPGSFAHVQIEFSRGILLGLARLLDLIQSNKRDKGQNFDVLDYLGRSPESEDEEKRLNVSVESLLKLIDPAIADEIKSLYEGFIAKNEVVNIRNRMLAHNDWHHIMKLDSGWGPPINKDKLYSGIRMVDEVCRRVRAHYLPGGLYIGNTSLLGGATALIKALGSA